jgi:hypothetical protein
VQIDQKLRKRERVFGIAGRNLDAMRLHEVLTMFPEAIK